MLNIDKSVLLAFTLATFIKGFIHVFYHDSGAFSFANFKQQNEETIVLTMTILGIAQLNLVSQGLYTLLVGNNKSIKFCIYSYIFFSFFTYMYTSYFYTTFKTYNFPFNRDFFRPGAKSCMCECFVGLMYFTYSLFY